MYFSSQSIKNDGHLKPRYEKKLDEDNMVVTN